VTGVFEVAQVRAAEDALMATLPDGALMQRAARGLEMICVDQVEMRRGTVVGAKVVVLAGTGNNGGDALWAAVGLARRGAKVSAFAMGERIHAEGAAALLAAGGRIIGDHDLDADPHIEADLIVDGIVGIGGSGALRHPADVYARAASASGALMIAVDVPSGVDADTGAVADADSCIEADVTVTFGCAKPGLLLAPGRFQVGELVVVDIGLAKTLPHARCHVLDDEVVAGLLAAPMDADYKYSRGVVGVIAGSAPYRGAALLATGAARFGNAGMVRYVERDEHLATMVVEQFWDVVVAQGLEDPRVTGWVVGPGMGTDDDALRTLIASLATSTPMVIDADALRLLGHASAREALRARVAGGGITVLTPHEGEFTGLGFSLPRGAEGDRRGAAVRAAADLGCVIVLKGPGTITAAPSGVSYIDVCGGAELGTAGSGDVLSGLMGAMLASAYAHRRHMTLDQAAEISAAAVTVHGRAGAHAARQGAPVTARDILASVPDAIAGIRNA
jgi:ADP-dependent NAD(P)H-hydrate dehydratase / NAD(P)H-hydrate epimerase